MHIERFLLKVKIQTRESIAVKHIKTNEALCLFSELNLVLV